MRMSEANEHAVSIRKSVILTTMVACVFWASDSSSGGINWIVRLDGWKAWSFLLLAHLYYSVMWSLVRRHYRDFLISPDGEAGRIGVPYEEYLADSNNCTWEKRFDVMLMTRLVDALALAGFVVIGWNLWESIPGR